VQPRAGRPSARPAPAREIRADGSVRVRLTFALPRKGRFELELQGPAPSCRLAARLERNGVRGTNRLDVRGRIEDEVLRPGVYVLTLTSASSGRALIRPVRVQVVSARRTILLGDAPASRSPCAAGSSSTPAGALPATPFAGTAPKPPLGAGGEATPEAPLTPPTPPEEVLGFGVPLPPAEEIVSPDAPLALTIAKLVVFVGLPLIALAAMLRRLLRAREPDELY
jgi:hypothetical protein